MPRGDSFISVLDVGTNKVTTLVASMNASGEIEFIGKGVSANDKGMIAGSVVNMEATKNSIIKSIKEAEKVGDISIRNVIVGISGEHISSQNSHGVVTVKGKEVTQFDIDKVIEQAKNIILASDRQIIGVEVAGFIVDDQEGIKNPKGMAGKRLETKVHIITASSAMMQNLLRCVEDAGVDVAAVAVNSLCSGLAVLEEDEKQLGVALIDIGKGTSDITVYVKGNPVLTAVVPMGGAQITSDISFALKIPPDEAERIKKKHGSAIGSLVNSNEEFDVSSIGGGEKKIIRSQALAGVIAPRVEEIMMLIKKKIGELSNQNTIATGIVLTGGTSKLKYIDQYTQEILGLDVRIGSPRLAETSSGIDTSVLKDPEYASAVGIVLNYFKNGSMAVSERGGSLWEKIKNFFKMFFE